MDIMVILIQINALYVILNVRPVQEGHQVTVDLVKALYSLIL